MEFRAPGHSLDCDHIAAFGVESERKTREYRLAVDEHGAGAAFAQLAAMFCSSQAEIFAQHFQQSLVWSERDVNWLAVQREANLRPGSHVLDGSAHAGSLLILS